jgi:rhodanese-related sulfurtransferase
MTRSAVVDRETYCEPEEVREAWRNGQEIALLDVRDEGPFSRAHPLFAVSAPLNHLEVLVGRLVPRKTTPMVVYDSGEGFAEQARGRLQSWGYTNVRLLLGGLANWAERGEVYRDVNSASKAFGEWVEAHSHTPSISAETFHQRRRNGELFVLLDARPWHEYQVMTIPGSINCPGAELVRRVKAVVKDTSTPVVVNCAGRTRSLIGAQSLINAGLENPVFALRNGTIGWLLAGLELEHGADRSAPEPGDAGRDWALEASSRLGNRFGFQTITSWQLPEIRKHSERKTCFFLDVRTREEYLSGHLEGFEHAPGGQLVQAPDDYLGVRNASLVLADDDGIRATMTASWLWQMGWRHIHIVKMEDVSEPLVSTPNESWQPEKPDVPLLNSTELRRLIDREQVTVLDVSRSDRYRRAHIPDAIHALRSDFKGPLHDIANRKRLVLTSEDGRLAAFAAAELGNHLGEPVAALAGGNREWLESGQPVSTDARFLSPPDDVYRRPYEGTGHDQSAMQGYIDWELELVAQLKRDAVSNFATQLPASAE